MHTLNVEMKKKNTLTSPYSFKNHVNKIKFPQYLKLILHNEMIEENNGTT